MNTGMTLQQRGEYVLQVLDVHNHDHDYTHEILSGYFLETVLGKIDQELTEEERFEMVRMIYGEQDAFEQYMSEHIKNRYTLLEQVVLEFLADEMIEETQIVMERTVLQDETTEVY